VEVLEAFSMATGMTGTNIPRRLKEHIEALGLSNSAAPVDEGGDSHTKKQFVPNISRLY
jgi:hypothetical protein